MSNFDRGSFKVADQQQISGLMLKNPKELTLVRYNNALKFLGETSPATVEIWLARPGADGQLIPSKLVGGDFTNPKGTAVVDCRFGNTSQWTSAAVAVTLANIYKDATDEFPKQIKNSFYCGGKLNQSNADLFQAALKTLSTVGLLTKPPARIVFYDNYGRARGPEMALRYIDTLLNSGDPQVKSLVNKQDIFFLDGGVSKYATNIPGSAFLADWPPKKIVANNS